MTRFAILATALVAAVASVSASPVATNGTALEKRTTHTGRVRSTLRFAFTIGDSHFPH